MKQKTYLVIVTVVFSAVSIFHLLRLIFKWNAIIGSWTVPLWLSIVAFIIAGFLAYQGIKLNRNK